MSNPTRPCFGCNVFDDHPRHEILDATTGSDAIGPMHLDCCAAKRGCVSCAGRREGVNASVIGEEFRQHLATLPPEQVTHVRNDNADDPQNLTTAVVTTVEG